MLQSDDSPVELSVALTIISEYQTKLSIVSDMIPCRDKSFLINCHKDQKLIKVKLQEKNLKTIFTFKSDVYGMAVLPSNDILLSTGESRLRKLSVITGKLSDTVYNVAPLITTTIHITSGNKVVVGGNDDIRGKSAVFVMNEKGTRETVYEHDQHNQPLFNYPASITSTSNGNILVADCEPGSDIGRVVVLGQGGDMNNTYTGHQEINKEEKFKPIQIVTTPRDNVIVVDLHTEVFHILNNKGEYLTFFNTKDNRRICPCSLAFTSTGKLYIGCTKPYSSTAKDAKIYQVTLSGC
ncbi:tripartite motif-containing protein 2-like [Mytilus edulis]|uniref:tripartite motif-containing protein 2-like n=1 Tax=Mytilus edulis TaxID=6550 RepID=UPI0039EF13DB